jgi:hypothetical protein
MPGAAESSRGCDRRLDPRHLFDVVLEFTSDSPSDAVVPLKGNYDPLRRA